MNVVRGSTYGRVEAAAPLEALRITAKKAMPPLFTIYGGVIIVAPTTTY